MAGSSDVRQGLEEVNQELQHVERQIERLLLKQQRLQQRKEQLEVQSSKLHELSLQAGSTDWEKSDYPWSAKLHSLKESVFGIKKLRPLQEKTMNASLSGRDVILLMPTGGGKSLCYQLPAIVSKGFTLVISPLVSLMEDQTMALEERGVNATLLNANTPPDGVKDVHRRMIDVHRADLRLLYVTPEKIAKSKRFMACLEKAYKAQLLARIAIDEVHCCSQWGHDFRPDYKILGLLKRQFSDTPILGLTATATMDVLDDVKGILGLQGCQVFRAGFNRPNLFYEVRRKPSKQADFVEELVRFINGEMSGQSGIIYCFSRKDTENLAENLKKHGIRAHPYHAFLDAQYRSYVHKNWKENNIQVVVATVAFGMGIDKPDVRFVIHHSISKSMENYYQESGRAGRDDEPAKCIVYYGLSDVFKQSSMVVTEQTGQQKLYNMVAYCVTPATCRRNLIGQHFGERWEDKARCNGMCDVCQAGTKVIEKDMVFHLQRIYKILDNVSKKEERITALKLTDELMSKKGVAALDKDQAKKMSSSDYEYLIIHFLLEGYLREDFHFTPYNTISYLLPGPKARHVGANPQQRVTVPFKEDGSHVSKVTGQSATKGWAKVKGVVKAGGSSTKATAKRAAKSEAKGDGKKQTADNPKGSEVQRGKAKKRKLAVEASIIDLCSDEDSGREDFASNKSLKSDGKSAKCSSSKDGLCPGGEKEASDSGRKRSSTTQKCIDGTEGAAGCGSGKNVDATLKSGCGTSAEESKATAIERCKPSKTCDRHNSGTKLQEVERGAVAKESNNAGQFTFKPCTSTQSLASPNPEGAHSTKQGSSRPSQDLFKGAKSNSNQPDRATSSKQVQSMRRPQGSASQRSNLSRSPGSVFELDDLRTVYTDQLRHLGSDGESFTRENSSFTMSTSFSGSEDGMGSARKDGESAPSGRRRKGIMKRVDSMDKYDDDEAMRDDFDTLKKVYTDQLKNLDESL